MKKYIQPQIEVNQVDFLLLGLSAHGEVGDDNEFANSNNFDENDGVAFSNKSLWED